MLHCLLYDDFFYLVGFWRFLLPLFFFFFIFLSILYFLVILLHVYLVNVFWSFLIIIINIIVIIIYNLIFLDTCFLVILFHLFTYKTGALLITAIFNGITGRIKQIICLYLFLYYLNFYSYKTLEENLKNVRLELKRVIIINPYKQT